MWGTLTPTLSCPVQSGQTILTVSTHHFPDRTGLCSRPGSRLLLNRVRCVPLTTVLLVVWSSARSPRTVHLSGSHCIGVEWSGVGWGLLASRAISYVPMVWGGLVSIQGEPEPDPDPGPELLSSASLWNKQGDEYRCTGVSFHHPPHHDELS